MIIIRTVGNPALYRSLQDGVASATRHRTVSGAVRRLAALRAPTRRWAESMGQWGRIEIEVNGRTLGQADDVGTILEAADDHRHADDAAAAERTAAQRLAYALAD